MDRNGFTLLELLVVLLVIALLSSIALPVLRQGRCKGQEIVCTSNLRQIQLAINIYQQENKTFPPAFCGLPGYSHPPTGMQGDSSYDWQGWWWFDFIADSISANHTALDTLWCPSRKIARGFDTEHVLCGNYGINTSICKIASLVTETEFFGKPRKITEIPVPASSLIVLDSGYALISWKALAPGTSPHTCEAPARQDTYYLPGARVNKERKIHSYHEKDALEGRHTHRIVNAGFADGHVGSAAPDTLSPVFDSQGNPVNYSAWSNLRNR